MEDLTKICDQQQDDIENLNGEKGELNYKNNELNEKNHELNKSIVKLQISLKDRKESEGLVKKGQDTMRKDYAEICQKKDKELEALYDQKECLEKQILSLNTDCFKEKELNQEMGRSKVF